MSSFTNGPPAKNEKRPAFVGTEAERNLESKCSATIIDFSERRKENFEKRREAIEAKFSLQNFMETMFPHGVWERRSNGPVFRAGNLFANVESDQWIDFDDPRGWSDYGTVALIAHIKGTDLDEATEIAERLYAVLAPRFVEIDGKRFSQWPSFGGAA